MDQPGAAGLLLVEAMEDTLGLLRVLAELTDLDSDAEGSEGGE